MPEQTSEQTPAQFIIAIAAQLQAVQDLNPEQLESYRTMQNIAVPAEVDIVIKAGQDPIKALRMALTWIDAEATGPLQAEGSVVGMQEGAVTVGELKKGKGK